MKKMARLNFEITEELHRLLKMFAGVYGESLTPYIRNLLQDLHTKDKFLNLVQLNVVTEYLPENKEKQNEIS